MNWNKNVFDKIFWRNLYKMCAFKMNCEHVSRNLAYSIYYSMSAKKQTWGVSSKTRRVQYLFYPPLTFYYFIIFHCLRGHFTIFSTPSSRMGVFFALWRRVGNSASTYIHFRWLKSLPSGQSRHPPEHLPLRTFPPTLLCKMDDDRRDRASPFGRMSEPKNLRF